MIFEFDEKTYELKYNLKRIEIIEKITGEPVIATISKNDGILTIANLRTYFSYGLKEAGSDLFVTPSIGSEICEKMIETNGYVSTSSLVLKALQADAGFLFRVD